MIRQCCAGARLSSGEPWVDGYEPFAAAGLNPPTAGRKAICKLFYVEHWRANGRGFGEECWIWFVFKGLRLRIEWVVCAWLQRMENLGVSAGNVPRRMLPMSRAFSPRSLWGCQPRALPWAGMVRAFGADFDANAGVCEGYVKAGGDSI